MTHHIQKLLENHKKKFNLHLIHYRLGSKNSYSHMPASQQ